MAGALRLSRRDQAHLHAAASGILIGLTRLSVTAGMNRRRILKTSAAVGGPQLCVLGTVEALLKTCLSPLQPFLVAQGHHGSGASRAAMSTQL